MVLRTMCVYVLMREGSNGNMVRKGREEEALKTAAFLCNSESDSR